MSDAITDGVVSNPTGPELPSEAQKNAQAGEPTTTPAEESSSGVTQDVTTQEEASKPSLPAFQAQLRGDLQGHEALEGIDSFSTLTQKYIELRQESASALKPLGEDATPEEREAYYQRLGVPETPDAYELPEHEADKSAAGNFAKLAKSANLDKTQAKAMYEAIMDNAVERRNQAAEAHNKQIAEAEKALKDQYGEETEKVLNRTTQFITEAGSKDLLDRIDRAGLGSDPELITLLHKAALIQGEDGLDRGDGTGAQNSPFFDYSKA
jgi:CRISPR/Cas system CSM-associated protein Csm2 small subunit